MDIESGFLTSSASQVIDSRRQDNASTATDAQKVSQQAAGQVAPANRQAIVRSGNEDTYQQAEQYRQQTFQDKPDAKGQKAIDAYQSLALSEKKQEFQQVMGVDIYA